METNKFEAIAHLKVLRQEADSEQGYEAGIYLMKFIEEHTKAIKNPFYDPKLNNRLI